MTTKRIPTAEQIAALQAYAAKNGRTWKDKLMTDWMNGRAQGSLQQVRNDFGPSWLARYKLPAADGMKPLKDALNKMFLPS